MKSDSFREFVLEQLEEAGDVSCRAMFGGYGLYRAGAFFGIIDKGRLYFKVSEASRVPYAQAGMKPFRPSAKQTLSSFYEVPANILESREDLAAWAATAAQAATTRTQAVRKHDRFG